MATLEKRDNRYRIVFRLNGEKFSRSIKTSNDVEAQSALARLNDGLRRLELGLLVPPDGADIVTFLFSDGRVGESPKPTRLRTLQKICDAFLESIIPGSIEENTLSCMTTHLTHIKRIIGNRFVASEITQQDLRHFAVQRLSEKGRRDSKVSSVTVRKELNTLRTVWSWATAEGIVSKPLPLRGLKLPKTEEKLPFATFNEVCRRIKRGGFSKKDENALWDSVFLPLPDLKELLEHVKGISHDPLLYPIFAFAAYTGVRRSEIIRSKIDDLDFEARTATINEKKRVPGQVTTRRVPLAEELAHALKDWLNVHPGGRHTFAVLNEAGQRATRVKPLPLTPKQIHSRFKTAVNGTKWEHLRGWHSLRHSFCSNVAAAGVDTRTLDSWVGHQTEEMRKRYRHLIPSHEQAAIKHVFG